MNNLLLHQIVASIIGRKTRSLLTTIGIAVGITIFLVTYGWTLSASSVINAKFDKTVATLITVKSRGSDDSLLPDDFQEKVMRLPGVKAAGRIISLENRSCWAHPGQSAEVAISVVDPGYFQAVQAEIAAGRLYDEAAKKYLSEPVGVLGGGLQEQFGMSVLDGKTTLECAGLQIPIYGSLRKTDASLSITNTLLLSKIPNGLDRSQLSGENVSGLVLTELGATEAVAKKLALQIKPENPEDIAVSIPPSPKELQKDITKSVNSLAIGVSILSLLVGGIGIMTTMFTSVIERTREIGLRRSLGARPYQIGLQFVVEGAIYGLAGSVLGIAVGLSALYLITSLRGWAAVIYPSIVLAMFPIGVLIGTVSALIPGVRASRIPPVSAIRSL